MLGARSLPSSDHLPQRSWVDYRSDLPYFLPARARIESYSIRMLLFVTFQAGRDRSHRLSAKSWPRCLTFTVQLVYGVLSFLLLSVSSSYDFGGQRCFPPFLISGMAQSCGPLIISRSEELSPAQFDLFNVSHVSHYSCHLSNALVTFAGIKERGILLCQSFT